MNLPAFLRGLILAYCGMASALVPLSANAAACIYPPAGLVSWWPGEGNAGDQMGANPGAVMNGVTFVPGRVGMAFFLRWRGQLRPPS